MDFAIVLVVPTAVGLATLWLLLRLRMPAAQARTQWRWFAVRWVPTAIAIIVVGQLIWHYDDDDDSAPPRETARDVERRLLDAETGILAHPTAVSCRRESRAWWLCKVTPRPLRNAPGQSAVTAQVRVPTGGGDTRYVGNCKAGTDDCVRLPNPDR